MRPPPTDESTQKLHVLVVTYPRFGHIVPLLELSRKIAKHHYVTFVISQCSYEELLEKELYSDAEKDTFKLYILEDELDMAHANSMAFHDSFVYMWDNTITAVRQLLSVVPTPSNPKSSLDFANPIDVVVGNIFVAKAMPVCVERNIPYYLFEPGNVDFIKYALLLDERTPTISNDATDAFMSPVSHNNTIDAVAEVFKHCWLPIKDAFPDCKGIVVNSTRDLEKRTIAECEKDHLLKNTSFLCSTTSEGNCRGLVGAKSAIRVIFKDNSSWLSVGRDQRLNRKL